MVREYSQPIDQTRFRQSCSEGDACVANFFIYFWQLSGFVSWQCNVCFLQYHCSDNTVPVSGSAQELLRGRFWFQGMCLNSGGWLSGKPPRHKMSDAFPQFSFWNSIIQSSICSLLFLSVVCVRCGTPFSASPCCTSTSPVCSWRRSGRLRERKSLTSKKKTQHIFSVCFLSNTG